MVHSIQAKPLCAHCGSLSQRQIMEDGESFCCNGCKFVWLALKSSGLGDYYSVRERQSQSGFIPQVNFNEGYLYFDDPLIIDRIVKKHSPNHWEVRFLVPEIYCAACVWLLEKLPQCNKGIIKTEVNLGVKSLNVDFDPARLKLSEIVRIVKSFGYTIQAYEDETINNHDSNDELSRLAVAVFSSMNCMMIGVSLYQGWWTGIDPKMKFFLEVISMVIALPAITYSAKPFIVRALKAIALRQVNLDVPLAFGIITGYSFSVLSIIFNLGEVYFDSITVLIALLLIARYGNSYTLAKFKNRGSLIKSVFPEYAFVKKGGSEALETYIKNLAVGDICALKSGNRIPADGKLVEGSLLIDSSLLNGESKPANISEGASLWAGTEVLEGEGLIRIERVQEESRFYLSLANLNEHSELGVELAKKIDKRSFIFVSWVMLVTSISFACHWYLSGFVAGYEAALAVVVISCPCALGISIPFTFTSACLKAAKEGIFFASGGVIEKIVECKKIVFDKTGTLTVGSFSQVSLTSFLTEPETNKLLEKIYLLERDELHPIARRISGFIAERLNSIEEGVDFTKSVKNGESVSGTFEDGSSIVIGNRNILHSKIDLQPLENIQVNPHSTFVYITENEILKLVISLADQTRLGMGDILNNLKKEDFEIYILSGDRSEVVLEVAAQLGVAQKNTFSEMLPEGKELEIKRLGSDVLMIGDGLNDTLALKAADVGVSVTGGLELLQKVGGAVILDFKAVKLKQLIDGSVSTIRAAKVNIIFSLLYNFFGTLLAAFGYVSPLVAAVLMPISSLIVLGISVSLPRFQQRY